ncbi:hypothetical protein BCR36DRAFT_49846 [Piromyces finnis]|uniref:protein O-GlcNAc transferase n=1 Tax=Piromyces finnis TaxID=1754191 RepID=A0A1Y1VNR4_9FUNG|nr:hypothetical protein BCR36DRAFT_49846 [Piromyces finnis]|eukprot:ORX60020.1 hypothetical protein BCR36DRAFT_49846 [Piromyces finnis]
MLLENDNDNDMKLPQLTVHDHLWNQAQTHILNSDLILNKSTNTIIDIVESNTEKNNNKFNMSNRYPSHQATILNGNNIQFIPQQNIQIPNNPYPINIDPSLIQQQQQLIAARNTLLQQQAKNQKIVSLANGSLNQPQPQQQQPSQHNPIYIEANQLANNGHRIPQQAYNYQIHNSLNSHNNASYIQNMEYSNNIKYMAYKHNLPQATLPQAIIQQIPTMQTYYSNPSNNFDYANNNSNKILITPDILNLVSQVGNENTNVGVVGGSNDTNNFPSHHFLSQNMTIPLPQQQQPSNIHPNLISSLQQQQFQQQIQNYQLQQSLSLHKNSQSNVNHHQQQQQQQLQQHLQQQQQLQQVYGHSNNYNNYHLQAIIGNANALSNPSAASQPHSQIISKENFDFYLQNAHQKYNSQDYKGALAILIELEKSNPNHLPTLLLLGCTYYSLNIYEASIIYNQKILEIDDRFSEAYSNLGTTYKAMAQEYQKNKVNDHNNVNGKPEDQINSAVYLKKAEECYCTAIKLRPKYWDASINLAILVSTQGRWKEAIQVYQKIETLMESDYPEAARMDFLRMDQNQSHGFINELVPNMIDQLIQDPNVVSLLTVGNNRMDNDILLVSLLVRIEENRKEIIKYQKLVREQENNAIRQEQDNTSTNSTNSSHHHHRRHRENNSFTSEKRCDLYFAKGNLYYALNQYESAKLEYFKGLITIGVDLIQLFNSSKSGTLPAPTIDPKEVLRKFDYHTRKPEASQYNHSSSSILQTLAKIYQDVHLPSVAVAFYYLSLQMYPTANTCNNLGILLSSQRLDESVEWYKLGLSLDPNHVHLFTNLGSALKDLGMVTDGIKCYEKAIQIQPDFFIALANLANVYKDMGKVEEAIGLYRRALNVKPDFIEAFCNYVNSLLFVCDWHDREKNLKNISAIVDKQLKESKDQVPKGVPTVLPFHTFTYSSLTAQQVREISHRNADRVLWNVIASDWFPGFPRSILDTYSHRPNVLSTTITSTASATVNSNGHYPYPYPIPPLPAPHIRIGYLSSDFNNHPLAHLMQSVFRMHDRNRFKVYCYSLSPSDNSQYRKTIEEGADYFIDTSKSSIKDIVERIATKDQIHVLVNLNGYTKGGKNEIFAARPCPIQIATMGFAGTMGAGNIDTEYDPSPDYNEYKDGSVGPKAKETDPDLDWFDRLPDRWMDYLVGDEVSCPPDTVINEPLSSDSKSARDIRNDPLQNAKIFTESIVYMSQSFFVNDHRQGFREENDAEIESILETDTNHLNIVDMGIKEVTNENNYELISGDLLEEDYLTLDEKIRWRREQLKRIKMRHELFPNLKEDTIIYANFNQLYKIDPQIFETWLNILKRMKNSILWLLRFPPSGESNLREHAKKYAGEEVAERVIFTDVAPKHMHIYRGRIADIFLDTVECNAHTTAADILWSGTPIITYPKYQFKMCSRVAASVAYATGTWNERDMKYHYQTVPCSAVGPFSEKAQSKKNPLLLGHEMVVGSYKEYEDRAVELGSSMTWQSRNIISWTKEYTNALINNQIAKPNAQMNIIKNIYNQLSVQTHNHMMANSQNPSGNTQNPQNTNSYTMLKLIENKVISITQHPLAGPQLEVLLPQGKLIALRRKLFLNRDQIPLFHTARWVAQLEYAVTEMMKRWEKGYKKLCERENQAVPPASSLIDNIYPSLDKPEERTLSRSIWVPEEVQAVVDCW